MFRNGSSVAFATFNATGANKTDWISVNRLIDSSWGDINSFAENSETTVSTDGM